ncbi:MAG: hypothetical protein IPH28_12010 [Cytophagaceae bacterium]|nr:hypothetical protein [Cytophagaceae bacterium]
MWIHLHKTSMSVVAMVTEQVMVTVPHSPLIITHPTPTLVILLVRPSVSLSLPEHPPTIPAVTQTEHVTSPASAVT